MATTSTSLLGPYGAQWVNASPASCLSEPQFLLRHPLLQGYHKQPVSSGQPSAEPGRSLANVSRPFPLCQHCSVLSY